MQEDEGRQCQNRQKPPAEPAGMELGFKMVVPNQELKVMDHMREVKPLWVQDADFGMERFTVGAGISGDDAADCGEKAKHRRTRVGAEFEREGTEEAEEPEANRRFADGRLSRFRA